MNDSTGSRRRRNRFAWLILPAMLALVLGTGSFALFHAHASSPLNGRFAFRGVTTSGPQTGLYITGQLEVNVSGSTITGGMCGYSLSPSHCVELQNATTPDGMHVAFTIHEIGKHPAIQVTGVFDPKLGSLGGFKGTYSFAPKGGATSSGRWEALSNGATPTLSGTWNIYALYTKGPNAGKSFHAVMTLLQDADGEATGTYCTAPGACQKVTGAEHSGHLYMYFFVGSPPTLEFRGNFTANHRASGQFQTPGPGGTLIELGYWLGH